MQSEHSLQAFRLEDDFGAWIEALSPLNHSLAAHNVSSGTLAPCFPANDLVRLLITKRRGEWVYAQKIDTGNEAGESGSIAVS
jgi:hypothetical protein